MVETADDDQVALSDVDLRQLGRALARLLFEASPPQVDAVSTVDQEDAAG